MTITGWAFRVLRLGLVAVLASSSVLASTVAVFGPVDVVRDKGKPRPVVFTFSSTDPSAPHLLRIDNGGENGEMRKVSSAARGTITSSRGNLLDGGQNGQVWRLRSRRIGEYEIFIRGEEWRRLVKLTEELRPVLLADQLWLMTLLPVVPGPQVWER